MTCTAFMCHGDPVCPDTHCPGRSHAVQTEGGCTIHNGVPMLWIDEPNYMPDEPIFVPEQVQIWEDRTSRILVGVMCGIALAAAFAPFIFRG